MENFRDIARLFLGAGAAIQVRDPQELARAVWLLENKEARERLGSSARRVLEQNSGATTRTLGRLRNYLDGQSDVRNHLAPEVK